MKRFFAVLLIVAACLCFFNSTFTKRLLPIPADTIVGMYYPYLDYFSPEYPRGFPFKNFLITDPVRQTYPWRHLALKSLRQFQLPLWNPYNLMGTPLLANFQSGALYPLNVIFFLLPFEVAWTVLVMLSVLLSGLFMYFYLSYQKLNTLSCLIGSMSFAFSGFMISWLEWNVLTHVLLWLPLLLLSIDKLKNKKHTLKWSLVFIFSLSAAFFAGHLQTFFYVFLTVLAYFIYVVWTVDKKLNFIKLFAYCLIIFVIITLPQSITGIHFILESARDVDPISIDKQSQFIPWRHLVQFIAPDFFGNPAKGNYWGEWNYGEFMGYIGLIPLLFAAFGVMVKKNKEVILFTCIALVSLVFALSTFIAKVPFLLNLPFISTSQPTRLLSIICFCLAVLSAYGFDAYLKDGRKFYKTLFVFGVIFFTLWAISLLGVIGEGRTNIAIRNLVLPTTLFIVVLISYLIYLKYKNIKLRTFSFILIILISVLDLLWVSTRFNAFSKAEFIFPSTRAVKFLQQNLGNYRYMSIDWRIMPPNFSIMYGLQSIDGYDPLYLRRTGEFIVALERNKADIHTPFGFYKRITPFNFKSKLSDLMGVKYVMSLNDLSDPKLKKVFEEGQTKVYENKNVIPRVFFVKNLYQVSGKEQNLQKLFLLDHLNEATIETNIDLPQKDLSVGEAKITSYKANEVIIETNNNAQGFLVLTDVFYPIWHVSVDGNKDIIYRTDYLFRGVVVPAGRHVIKFYNTGSLY